MEQKPDEVPTLHLSVTAMILHILNPQSYQKFRKITNYFNLVWERPKHGLELLKSRNLFTHVMA